MSGGTWRNGLAFGLVVGIGLTLVFCYATLGVRQPSKPDPYSEHSAQQPDEQGDQQQNLLTWWQHDGVLVTSKDTLAQWAMAIIAVIATAVSVWAVIVIKKTLDVGRETLVSTQKMARETREIGEAQVRAYLSVDECFITPEIDGTRVKWNLRFALRNTGQSPARNLKCRIWLNFEEKPTVFGFRDLASGPAIEHKAFAFTDVDKLHFSAGSDVKVIVQASIVISFDTVFGAARQREVGDFFGHFWLLSGIEVRLTPSGGGVGPFLTDEKDRQ